MRRLAAPVSTLVAALLMAAAISSCAAGGPGMMSVSAEFPDVGSLAHHAAVEMSGVNIGYVSHITLQGDHARLTLTIPRSARVPASAYAQVRRAAILGPQVIEIVVPPGAPAVPLLANGADLPQSANQVRPDLEDLIKTGTDVIGALSASDLARLLQENATGFGGEGPTLHAVIDNLNTVLSGYASRTATITQLVNDLNSFSSALAPSAAANAQAVSNLSRATAILDAQKDRLTNLLIALDNVSQQGASAASLAAPADRRPIGGPPPGDPGGGQSATSSRNDPHQPRGAQPHHRGGRLQRLHPGHPGHHRLRGSGRGRGPDLAGQLLPQRPGRSESMISRRTIINLVVFFGLSSLLIVYGFASLVHNPLANERRVLAVLPDTGGLKPGFSVTMRGVPVGAVSSLKLIKPGVLVTVDLQSGQTVPADVAARVVRANPLGEQQLELVPEHGGTAPPLPDGATVPTAADPVPPAVGDVVDAANRLFDTIPTKDLNTLIHETAIGLDGRSQDLRSIIESVTTISQVQLQFEDGFRSLLANGPPVLDTISAVGPQLRQALANTVVLTDILARRSPDLVHLFQTGSTLGSLGTDLLNGSGPNLSCLLSDLASVTTNVASQPNLANLDRGLLLNQYFFGPINAIGVDGPFKSLTASGSPARSNQQWLRTELVFPPGQPAAVAYVPPRRLPPTKPGGACLSVFGAGVGPATQANAQPPGPAGYIIPRRRPARWAWRACRPRACQPCGRQACRQCRPTARWRLPRLVPLGPIRNRPCGRRWLWRCWPLSTVIACRSER